MKKIIVLLLLLTTSFAYCAEQSYLQQIDSTYIDFIQHVGHAKTELHKIMAPGRVLRLSISLLEEEEKKILEWKEFFLQKKYDEAAFLKELERIKMLKKEIDFSINSYKSVLNPMEKLF